MVSYLYLVKRTDNVTWDEYDSFVVCAESEDEARRVYPSEGMFLKMICLNKASDISNGVGQIRLKPWK